MRLKTEVCTYACASQGRRWSCLDLSCRACASNTVHTDTAHKLLYGKIVLIFKFYCSFMGRYSDSLRAGWSGGSNPVGRARFSALVQTGPAAHPASYTMGTGSFPGVKQPGRGVDHPTLSSAKVKEKVELYLYSPSGPSWPVLGRTCPFTFTFTIYCSFLLFLFCE